MDPRPPSCSACPMFDQGSGWVPADGPDLADILVIGEAPGFEEARAGKPFVGASGYKLNSLLKRVGIAREQIRVHNILSCRPPGNELRGASYESGAIWHCKQHLAPTLREPHKVIIAAGAIASRNLLNIYKKFKIDNFHGQPCQLPDGNIVVTTYHPSFLLQGSQKLTGVVCFDLLRAKSIADGSFKQQPASLKVDPDIEWFRSYATAYIEAIKAGKPIPLAVDVETEEKSGASEDELKGTKITVTRINFSYNPDEGITVPWIGEYRQIAIEMLEAGGELWFWNWRYDVKLLRGDGVKIGKNFHDLMNMAKMLNSDLPLGLGFWAPFYSNYINPSTKSGAWKHLSDVNMGEYAAIDGFQTRRIGDGLVRDLKKSGQWNTYLRHTYELDTIVLHPAEDIGLHIARPELIVFRDDLAQKEAALQGKIQTAAGDDARPWEGGLKKPRDGYEERLVELEIWICTDCGVEDVTEKHKCKKAKVPKEPKKPRKPRAKKSAQNKLDDICSDLGLSAGDDTPSSSS